LFVGKRELSRALPGPGSHVYASGAAWESRGSQVQDHVRNGGTNASFTTSFQCFIHCCFYASLVSYTFLWWLSQEVKYYRRLVAGSSVTSGRLRQVATESNTTHQLTQGSHSKSFLVQSHQNCRPGRHVPRHHSLLACPGANETTPRRQPSSHHITSHSTVSTC
jgi:hypothetical protein